MLLSLLQQASTAEPALWLQIIVWISAAFQVIIALIILISYTSNSHFREKPGSIILIYGISALCLSILWAFNFNLNIGDSTFCMVIGALAIFFEYNCIFYEIAFIYYFVCYFKNEEELKEVKDSTQLVSSEVSLSIGSHQQYVDIPQLQLEQQIYSLEDLNMTKNQEVKDIKQKYNNVVSNNSELVKHYNLLAQNMNKMIEKLEKKSEKKKTSSPLSYIQAKINCFVLILSITMTLMPALFNELGPDFYGACSKKEISEETQDTGVIFSLVISAFNAVASAFGLIYFYEQKRKRQERLEELTIRSQSLALSPCEKEQEHYLKHIKTFIVVTMVCNWTFSVTNIYADLYEKKHKDDKDDWWESSTWKVLSILHFLMLAAQGFALLWLKLSEPLTKEATGKTIQNFKEWLRILFCCCKKNENRSEARNSLIGDVDNTI